MKTVTTILALSIITFFPMAAFAEGFGNLNINLNDVMVGQRMQEMSQRLNDAGSASIFKAKKEHKKHEKKNKEHKMAMLQDNAAAGTTTGATTSDVVPDGTKITGSIPQ
jgi:hypothetical protein